MIRAMELKQALKERALDIGFDLVGIAPVVPGRDLEFARKWVKRGYGGEMRYLANPRRGDPRAILPSVKSVICVGLLYDTPFPYSSELDRTGVRSQESEVRRQEPEGRGQAPASTRNTSATDRISDFQFPVSPAAPPRAWISRYAWGEDYHEIVRAKLEKLRAALEELVPGVQTRVFVDTGPIVERAFARFSGLGWMGKNTCIINEAKGSWFFLGVVLTNLELEPDLPAPDRCGSCTACLEACPTGALVEPYVMDASRCISYLTIELRGSIPEEFRPALGANVFGCDICQDVCPWNARSRSQESGVRSQEGSRQLAAPNFQPLVVNRQSAIDNRQFSAPGTVSLFSPPLEPLGALSEEDFHRVFARSPIKRAKYRGWLRNLCVAMGNSGDARFIPWLERAREHSDPIIREHAAWALNHLRP
ncbi:MAG: tRNA epoxyqueuosine(34) reductase QueG [Terriglobia bacterium]